MTKYTVDRVHRLQQNFRFECSSGKPAKNLITPEQYQEICALKRMLKDNEKKKSNLGFRSK